MKFADILNHLNPSASYIDGPDVNLERLEQFIRKMLSNNDVSLFVEHKADVKYPIVSAASIIAKVTRDEEIKKIKREHNLSAFGDLGSGYPSDPLTVQWMKKWINENKEFPDCVRKSWMTTEIMMAEKEQSKLSEWFGKFRK